MTLAALTHALPSLQAAKRSAVGLCAAVVALAAGPARAESLAYVPNEKAGTVSVIDTAADQVIGEIEVGVRPRGVAASPDGKFLYVSDQRKGRASPVSPLSVTCRKAGVSPDETCRAAAATPIPEDPAWDNWCYLVFRQAK